MSTLAEGKGARRPLHVVMFYHSLVSDWNHGNAHFLRGVVEALMARGHRVSVYEPHGAWSREQLVADQGEAALDAFHRAYPLLHSTRYDPVTFDADQFLHDADVVLVHEWNEPGVVSAVGRHRASHGGYRLFFHDTHHRLVSAPHEMAAYDLSGYDGVLAFGSVLRERYDAMGWGSRAFTWHEAADVRRFHPVAAAEPQRDLVWIGNWGDGERAAELKEFLLRPVRTLRLDALVHGVRYPPPARRALRRAGVEYGGWLPNFRVPELFARARCTVHVPRRFYRDVLPGIPTIRVFEALACGIPLVSASWDDCEGLFTPGLDYLTASDGTAMTRKLTLLMHDTDAADAVAKHGMCTVRTRHTCAHRVQELLDILARFRAP